MQKTIEYILNFLLRDNTLLQYVGYTDNMNEWHKYKVVVVPSGFFTSSSYGAKNSLPTIPLPTYNNLPIIYGKAQIEKADKITICHIDVVASVYFLISRYEEYVCSDSHRDIHHRFIGKESLPYRCNFLHRPIVEEYGELLLNLLQQHGINTPAIPQKFDNIYLTHDIDTIAHYRTLRGALGGIKRAIGGGYDHLKTIIAAQTDILHDPAYTFPWIIEQDNRCRNARQIYFFKAAANGSGCDYPQYDLNGTDFHTLAKLINTSSPNAEIGLHCSYASGSDTSKIAKEHKRLRAALPDRKIVATRHHYLRSLQPQDMESLIEIGITDDYTMGYADITGFRLGTCRAVRFINPATRSLTPLTLHPLSAMDCTLSDTKYMNLSEEQALNTVANIIDVTRRHHGDLCLLWHNTIFDSLTNTYHQHLYKNIINLICRQKTVKTTKTDIHNILIISDSLTQPLYTPRVRFLYKSLLANNIKADWFTEKFEEIPSEFELKINEIPFYKYHKQGIIGKIEWLLKNILNVLFDYKNNFFAKKTLQQTVHKQYDLVFCSSFHSFGLKAAFRVAKQKKIPLHIDLRDIAEQCSKNEYSSNIINNSESFFGSLYRKINIARRNRIIRQADSVSSVSPWHVEYLKRFNENTHLVYNGYDSSLFSPQQIKTPTFDIVYTGRWYGNTLQDPTLLFQALSQINQPDIRLVWYTNKNMHRQLQQMAERYNITTTTKYNGYVPNASIPKILNRASIILVLTNIGTHGIMTTKFFEALGVEKPILCVRSDEECLAQTIKETDAGLAATNVDEVKQFILKHYDTWKQQGYTHVEIKGKERFSRQEQAKQFMEIFNSAIQTR